MIRARRGFVLLAVLWVLIGLTALTLGAVVAGRAALASARNRAALAQAEWRTEGCIARAQAAANDAMGRALTDSVLATWAELARAIVAAPTITHSRCVLDVHPTGISFDINTADASDIRRFLSAVGIAPVRADSMIDALLDWRDADTIPRPFGAERAWYRRMVRPLPRDSQLADRRELLRVRGFETFETLLPLVSVDSARVPLTHAPAPVIAALPGLPSAARSRIAEIQMHRERLADLLALGMTLAPADRAALLNSYPLLSQRATPSPETWTVIATAQAGTPTVDARLEVVLARAGRRVAIIAQQ